MMQKRSPSGFKVKGRSRNEIRREALKTRDAILTMMQKASMSDVSAKDLFEQLSKFGIEYQIIEDNSEDIKLGVPAAMIGSNLILRDGTYEGIVKGNPRDIFTLYHEIGHYILKHERELNRGQIGEHDYYEDSEWQANAFASEILMPLDEIIQMLKKQPYFDWTDIYDSFPVSMQAAQYRYDKLVNEGVI